MRWFLPILWVTTTAAWAADSYPTSLRTISPGNVWTNVGCIKDPDSVTTIFVVMGTGSTASQINTQIGLCPSNQVVLLTNGTFSSLGGDIVLNKNGVVLRGMTNSSGFPITILSGGKIFVAKTGTGSISGLHYPSPSEDTINSQNISSGLSAGSTSITLSSSANSDFAVGDLFCIDQNDDNSNVWDASTGLFHRSDRSYVVVRRCTSKSGATLGFEPPLVGAYWNSGLDPEAWGWSSYLGATLLSAGVEDIKFTGSSSENMVQAGPIYDCWIRNLWITVGSSIPGSARIRLAYSCQSTISKCIIPDSPAGSSSSYAMYPTVDSYIDISHNAITNYQLWLPTIALSTSFIGYNVGIGPFNGTDPNFLYEYVFPHGGHDHDNLYEGNWIGAGFYADAIFSGNSGNSGLVRNRIRGWDSGKTGNRVPITLESNMVNYVFLGNVLGAEEFHTSYSQIYNFHATVSGTIRTNNYNTVDNGVNSAETQAGGNSTANSYRYTSRPAMWGDTECVWPPYGPESTQGTNTLAYTNVPAGYRIYYGVWPDGVAGGGGEAPAAGPGTFIVNGPVTMSGVVIR